MKIRVHSDSHIVELEDGPRWQIFPGDLDLTLEWKPETELTVVETEDEVATHWLRPRQGPREASRRKLACRGRQACSEGRLEAARDHPRHSRSLLQERMRCRFPKQQAPGGRHCRGKR